MPVNVLLEPLVVITLLVGGALVNRNRSVSDLKAHERRPRSKDRHVTFAEELEAGTRLLDPRNTGSPTHRHRSQSPSSPSRGDGQWRTRPVGLLRWRRRIATPDTSRYSDTVLSRLLYRFPFLVEAWYWALIYWVYQLGRAFTAVRLDEGTVDLAREHAFTIINLEKRLGIFFEPSLQAKILRYPHLLACTNWVYSYIHIPATILFLVWLYYHTITASGSSTHHDNSAQGTSTLHGPALYEARRRTMAMCNLIAFAIFTSWPCMPPRLLSDPGVNGAVGNLARSYGFVDTVHSETGSGSVWTSNKFCNQWAAMPSLHFGYSLLIGMTIATLPLAPPQEPWTAAQTAGQTLSSKMPSWRRTLCICCGILYPCLICFAVIATANHFVLDVVAGAIVCALGWLGNRALLNLLPLEDYFLSLVRIHKPELRQPW